MWQLLLGAAIAGSAGFLARHLLNPSGYNPFSNRAPIRDDDRNLDEGNGDFDGVRCFDFVESGCQSDFEKQKQDGIFRFSSAENWGKTESRAGERNWGKKGAKKGENRSGDGGSADSCSSRDSSALLGISLGIMYMMSVGKAEISKLNLAADETTKVVQELRAELRKRRLSRNPVASNSANVADISSKNVSSQTSEFVINKLSTQNSDLTIDDGGYASSVLTEEPERGPEDLEMTQLEAELEAELLKLSQIEVSDEKLNESEGQQSCGIHPNCGVPPSELNQKLCELLIEQQGSQIMELESELHLAQSKLSEKEAELQALKDCVRRLTALPLSTVSDDEAEVKEEREHNKGWDRQIKIGLESRTSSILDEKTY